MHCRVLIIQVLNKSKHARIRDWTIEYRNTLIKVAYKCQLMKIFIKNWNIKFGKYFKRHDKKMKEYRTILMESKQISTYIVHVIHFLKEKEHYN